MEQDNNSGSASLGEESPLSSSRRSSPDGRSTHTARKRSYNVMTESNGQRLDLNSSETAHSIPLPNAAIQRDDESHEPRSNTDLPENNHVTETEHNSDVEENKHAADTNDAYPNPESPLEHFDWDDLEARYHDMIAIKYAEEQQILEEFHELCQYFKAWAETCSGHEVDRSFKRLKTQATFVRHEEGDLESRKQHYVKVVTAFQAALSLLNA